MSEAARRCRCLPDRARALTLGPGLQTHPAPLGARGKFEIPGKIWQLLDL
jgi:hypothetical protein